MAASVRASDGKSQFLPDRFRPDWFKSGCAMLELRQAFRSLGGDALLAGVDLTLSSDAPTSVLGLNAPGRELMLRLLAGSEKLKGGEIRLGGRDIAQARRGKLRILQVGPAGMPKSGQKVGKILDVGAAGRVGLSGRLSTPVSQLNTEERVRLAIGKAVQDRPALLMLDAPASMMAPDQRGRFTADLAQIVSGAKGIVVLLAGGADEAMGMGGNAVVLSEGRVQQAGSVARVFAAPVNLASAVAVAWPTLNTVTMTMDAGRGRLADGASLHLPDELGLPAAGPCTLAFRPDDSTLARETPGCLRFVARAVAEQAVSGRMYKRLGFHGETWLSPLVSMPAPPGSVLNVFVDRGKLMVFDAEGAALLSAAPNGGATTG
jgi:ABC-type sugar transport system ATPase subunit